MCYEKSGEDKTDRKIDIPTDRNYLALEDCFYLLGMQNIAYFAIEKSCTFVKK